LKVEN